MILDTNALFAFVDGDEGVAKVLRTQSRVALPVIVLGEFRYGITRSRHRREYEAWLRAHLRGFEVLTVSEDTSSAYALVRLRLHEMGRPIPANDAWIAALAIEHDMPVLTRDAHFDAVPALRRRSF